MKKILKNLGKDEAYCSWYECPHCKSHNILPASNFCSECGLDLRNYKFETE